MPSVQDKHRLLEDPILSNYLRSRYMAALQDGWWWLEPMPPLTLSNLPARVEYARRMSGIHGVGDPVWGASIIHMAEQAAGTPFSIEGPESAVKKAMDLLFSAPGGYREMIKQLCLNWVTADIGAPLEIIWSVPQRIRDGVYFKPKPVGLDVFDPARLRLVAPQNAEYPYAYRSNRAVNRPKPPGWDRLFGENEIPLHKNSVGRIVNLPQTAEELLGCGVSPASIAVQEWQIAMGNLGLLLQDSTNTTAYTILVARGLGETQVVQAMENRQKRLEEHQTHALASALMLFANEDTLGDGGPGPSIQGVPLRRYAENWDWRMWLEERIQVYATILGISPMSIIMSIYARANQAGAQYAADEAGVRRTSLMVGLSDLFADLTAKFGATFQFRSQRLADRDREYQVKRVAAEAWRIMYEANNNGVPLLADTPLLAAQRARTMMAEERLIKEEYAEGEDYVLWDTEPVDVNKSLAFLSGALKGERYVRVDCDLSGQSTRMSTTVIGRCVLREPGRPTQWRGWSSAEIKRWAPLQQAASNLKANRRKEVGALPSRAPRRQRQLQQAWEDDLNTALRKLRRELEELRLTPEEDGEPSEMPEFSDRQAEQLQEYLDRWEIGIAALEASGRFEYPEKLIRARMALERLQAELNNKKNERNTRILLAALAIFIFSDSVQRRGQDRIQEGMMLFGMPADHGLLQAELRNLGTYLQGSLLPDLIDEYLTKGYLSQRLERRMIIFYGGALWTAMQLAMMSSAQPGARLRVEGPRDDGNCRESDPGEGLACETIVGQVYTVGVDTLPVLGRDTKCRQACRHWWEPA